MSVDFELPAAISHREVAEKFKEHNERYSEDELRATAKLDASAGIPLVEQVQPCPFESEMTFACEKLASTIASRYKGPLERLDAQIRAEHDFVERQFQTETQRIESNYQAEREAAENSFGIKDAHKQLEAYEKHFHALHEKLGRGVIEYIPHWLYWTFAFLIFVGEIPLNALVFQIFGENQVMTWVMAFIIGLSIPLGAHFIGLKYRERAEFGVTGPRAYANIFKATIALAVMVAALYGLSVMRTTYLGEMKEALGLTEALVESSFLFFYLNIAVLGAAIMIAYLSHDPYPGFQAARDEMHRARRICEERESERVYRLKACADKRSDELQLANEKHREGVSRVIKLKGQFDQMVKEGQELESRCLDRLRRDISIYRAENLRARESKVMPKSFETFPSIPLELQAMQEKLHHDT